MGSTSKGPPGKMDEDVKAQLEWIRFREDVLGEAAYSEPASAKFWRRVMENPFVPIGGLATVCALGYGLWCFRAGRSRHSQLLMRARIGAQGFTIIAILAGVSLGVSSNTASPPPAVAVEAQPAPTKT